MGEFPSTTVELDATITMFLGTNSRNLPLFPLRPACKRGIMIMHRTQFRLKSLPERAANERLRQFKLRICWPCRAFAEDAKRRQTNPDLEILRTECRSSFGECHHAWEEESTGEATVSLASTRHQACKIRWLIPERYSVFKGRQPHRPNEFNQWVFYFNRSKWALSLKSGGSLRRNERLTTPLYLCISLY